MEGKWRNVERHRSQAISHGVSTPKKQIGARPPQGRAISSGNCRTLEKVVVWRATHYTAIFA